MVSPTRGNFSRGYVLPTCRRGAANARCIRRVLLSGLLRLAACKLSDVLECTAPETKFSTAKTYSTSLQSLVPTTGRCPLTPGVAARAGTIGKRASSWLSSASSPACAFFEIGQLLLGLDLRGRVARAAARAGGVGSLPWDLGGRSGASPARWTATAVRPPPQGGVALLLSPPPPARR